MALGDSYATLTELKSRLGITGSSDDTALTNALAVASRGIEHCTHRQFNDAGSATARTYYVTGLPTTVVDDFSTTVGLVIATDSGSDGTFETTHSATAYELHPLNGIVDGQPGWPFWRIKAVRMCWPVCTERASLQVTARWGWAAIPAGVKEACLIVAEETFKLKDAPFGVAGYGEYGAVRVRENPLAYAKIAPYVRHRVLVA